MTAQNNLAVAQALSAVPKIHPWHIVSRSMQPGKTITFNYDTNEIIEVQLGKETRGGEEFQVEQTVASFEVTANLAPSLSV